MRRSRSIISVFVIAALTLTLCGGYFDAGLATAAAYHETDAETEVSGVPEDKSSYIPGELIVTFSDSTSNKEIKNVVSDADAGVGSISSPVDEEKVAMVKVEKGEEEDAIKDLAASDSVVSVQPNYRYRTYASEEIADDPYMTNQLQYHFNNSSIKQAWNIMKGQGIKGKTKVAVIDTGVDIDHEDLQKNLTSNVSYKRFANGKVTDETEDSEKSEGHGTHVTGLIGATYKNGKGGAGAAAGNDNNYVEVLPIGASAKDGFFTTYDLVRAIDYADSEGAKVINLSLGGDVRDRVLGTCIKEKYAKGITFVAAAGNDNTNYDGDPLNMSYPASMKEVIGVCNIKNDSNPDDSSNYGNPYDISAPGVGLMSTIPEAALKYGTMTGTSMSAPIVSSVCALLLDIEPDLTPAEIRNIICATAEDNTELQKSGMGYGALNASKAVDAVYGGKQRPESISIKSIGGKYLLNIYNTVASQYAGDTGIGVDTLVMPAYSDLSGMSFTSSDTSFISIDSKGIARALRKGSPAITGRVYEEPTSGQYSVITAKIRDKTSDGVKMYVVSTDEPEYVNLSNYPSVMKAGEDTSIKVGSDTVSYIECTQDVNSYTEEIYWSSSNVNVAFVDDLGIVYAVSPGVCTITVRTYNGKSASFKLTVTDENGNVPDDVTPDDGSSPEDGDSDRYINGLEETTTHTITRIAKPKAKAAKKKATITFKKAKLKTVTESREATYDRVLGEIVSRGEASTSTKLSSSITRYQIAYRKAGGRWKKVNVPAKKKNTSKYKVRVKGGKLSVTLKKLSSKKRYQVKVRAYKKVEGENIYGKWSKVRKFRVK